MATLTKSLTVAGWAKAVNKATHNTYHLIVTTEKGVSAPICGSRMPLQETGAAPKWKSDRCLSCLRIAKIKGVEIGEQ